MSGLIILEGTVFPLNRHPKERANAEGQLARPQRLIRRRTENRSGVPASCFTPNHERCFALRPTQSAPTNQEESRTMNPHPQILRPRTLNVVVEPSQMLPDHSRQMRLYSERRTVDAWYWGDLPGALPCRLRKAVAYLVPVYDGEENRTHLVITRFDWYDDMEAFALVPDSFGIDPEDVYRGRELMDWVKHPAVRQLLSDVFTEPGVFFNYWTASRRPQAEAGSLVRNAVILGEYLRNRTFLAHDLLDLGIAYAVLRDLSNVWYQISDDSANAHRKALSVMVQKLAGPLAHFRATCPEYASILRELLLAPLRLVTDRRAQILMRYASEVPEHNGPLIVDSGSN